MCIVVIENREWKVGEKNEFWKKKKETARRTNWQSQWPRLNIGQNPEEGLYLIAQVFSTTAGKEAIVE